MSGTAVLEAAQRVRAAYEDLAATDIDALTREELLSLGDELQGVSNALPTQWHRLLTRLKTQTHPKWLGAKTWNEVLRTRWRLSTAEAGRRLADAEHLGPRQAFTGAPLEPTQAAIAAAQSLGLITGEQVTLIRDTLRKIPKRIDHDTRCRVEVDLVRIAARGSYQELRTAAALRLLLLDQDGPEPDLEERDRKRGASLCEQWPDLITEFRAFLTP